MADVLAERRAERERLLALARSYVDRISRRLEVRAAVVVGSVARGDFNVWSDVDVVLIVDELPERAPDRMAALLADAPPGVQPIGFSREEFRAALRKGNPLALEACGSGLVLAGGDVIAGAAEPGLPGS